MHFWETGKSKTCMFVINVLSKKGNWWVDYYGYIKLSNQFSSLDFIKKRKVKASKNWYPAKTYYGTT